MQISDEVSLELPTLINFTGFIIYLCLPSCYCQVVASRTYVATAVPNEIKNIDSKDPTARLVGRVYNYRNRMYNIRKMARFDKTDRSIDIIVITIETTYYSTNNKLCTFVKRYMALYNFSTAV